MRPARIRDIKMKKQIRLFTTAMVFIAMSLCVSCNKDDEEQNGGGGTGNHEYHEYVDLGLSVKWATCNLGATNPEDYGDYFAWGETTAKSNYDWTTYKWCNGSYNTLTKYNTDLSCGTVDNKTMLDLADDAAAQNWGYGWRMPTQAEWQELYDNTTSVWTTQNGVYGRLFTGTKPDYTGVTLFLPAAGYRDGTSLYGAGSIGHFWSGSLYSDNPNYACSMLFYSGYVTPQSGLTRCIGFTMRPVR